MMTTISIVCSLLVIRSFGNDDWEYETVENWGNLQMTNNYCSNSYHTQSPINIHTEELNACPSPESELDWTLSNEINKFVVLNNGHDLHFQLIPDGDEDLRFGTLKNNFGGSYDEYCLDSFHIHWGLFDDKGSEHQIDNLGKTAELHFVHYACQYESLSAALLASEDDSVSDKYVLAVVAVLLEVGEENKFLSSIFNINSIFAVMDQDNEIEINSVTMDQLIPSSTNLNDYYYYKGSLTTPTCNPVVQWYVLRNAITMSKSQIYELRKVRDSLEQLAAPCVRPPQTNTNPVYHCKSTADQIES